MSEGQEKGASKSAPDLSAIRDRWTRSVYTEGFTGTEAADKAEALAMCSAMTKYDDEWWEKRAKREALRRQFAIVGVTFFVSAFLGGAFISQSFKHGWLWWPQDEIGHVPSYTCKLVEK